MDERPCGLWIVNPDGLVRDVNATGVEQLRETREHVIGRAFAHWIAQDHRSRWTRILAEPDVGRGTSLRVHLSRADGRALRARLILHAVNEGIDGRSPLRVCVLDEEYLDEELHETRRRARRLIDLVPALVSHVDREHRYVMVNAGYEAWFGKAVAEIEGQHVRSLLGEDTYRFVLPRLEAALAGVPQWFENVLADDGTGERHVRVLYEPDRDETGRTNGIFCFAQDVTLLRRTEQTARQYAEDAAAAEESVRRQLSCDLHDDVGQLLALASIKLEELAARRSPGGTDPALQELRSLIRKARERVTSFSFQLSPPLLEDTGLPGAVEWLFDDLRTLYGLQIRRSGAALPDDLAEPIRLVLFRALRELLVNVVRHAGTLEADVLVELEADHVFLEVRDRGSGFDMSRTPPRPGLGVHGLRRRVEQLGGTLSVESAPCFGTRARLRVPGGRGSTSGGEDRPGPRAGTTSV